MKSECHLCRAPRECPYTLCAECFDAIIELVDRQGEMLGELAVLREKVRELEGKTDGVRASDNTSRGI